MSSMLSSKGFVLATSMAVSAGTVILFDLLREKYFPPTEIQVSPAAKQALKSCLSSGGKKKKKRVKFADDVKDSRGNSELYRKLRRKSSRKGEASSCCGNEILEYHGMPANRVALYSGILRDRVQRIGNYWRKYRSLFVQTVKDGKKKLQLKVRQLSNGKSLLSICQENATIGKPLKCKLPRLAIRDSLEDGLSTNFSSSCKVTGVLTELRIQTPQCQKGRRNVYYLIVNRLLGGKSQERDEELKNSSISQVVSEIYTFFEIRIVVYGGNLLSFGLIATWISQHHRLHGSSGCIECHRKYRPTYSLGKPLEVNTPHHRNSAKPRMSEYFFTTRTRGMDDSKIQSQGSISPVSALTHACDDAGCSNNPSDFINHGLLNWNQSRQKWTENKKAAKQSQQLREPLISWNATYNSLLGSNKRFFKPIPLGEMVDFLVDIWEEEGMYD